MIKLETKSMTRAIERAKAVHPKVRVISASERIYAVTGRAGNAYTVRFVVANNLKLGSCDCPARGMCYHIASAAAVNIGIQAMRKETAPAAVSCPALITSIESGASGQRYKVVRCNGWTI